jgi:hypothetical protein
MDVDKFIKQLAWYLLGVLVCFILTILLGSCKTTKYITVPEYHYRDSVRVLIQRDSVYRRDSSYFFSKGDTVYHEHFNTVYHERFNSDTLSYLRRDSIPKPYPVIKKETVYRQRWWQKDFMWIGIVAIISLCGYGIFRYRKLLVKVLRL